MKVYAEWEHAVTSKKIPVTRIALEKHNEIKQDLHSQVVISSFSRFLA